MKRSRNLNVLQLSIISGLITAIVFFIMTTITDNNPIFGGVIVSGDMPDQYLSFFQYYRYMWSHLGQISYSFSNGLGGPMTANISYYLLSPFNLLILLFPASKMNIALYLIIWLKIAVATGTFSWTLSKLFEFKYSVYPMFLGTCYGLSSYVMSYFGNLMWLDGIILLPLLVYWLKQLIYKDKRAVYIILLSITIISNYYIAYMICVFLVLAFLFMTINKFENWKTFEKQTIRFGISSILAGLISAFVLLPTFLNLKNNKLNIAGTANFKLDSALVFRQSISKLFIGNINTAMPALFASTIVLILFITYFLDSHNSKKEKLLNGAIGLIFIASLLSTRCYLLWHGYQKPVSFPFRFTFLIIFWMLLLAGKELSQSSFTKKNLYIATSIVLILAIIASFLKKITNTFNIYTIIALLLIPTFMYLLMHINNKYYRLILCILGLAEIMLSSYSWLKPYGIKDNIYDSYISQNQALFNKIPAQYKNQRIAKNYFLNNDRGESYTFNYHGDEVFSSNNDPKLSDFYSNLGLSGVGYFYFYQSGTQVTDAILGNKIFINSTIPDQKFSPQYISYGLRDDLKNNQVVLHQGSYIVYKLAALPIGFSGNLANNIKLSATDPISNQNTVIDSLTGNKKQILSYGKNPTLTTKNIKFKKSAAYFDSSKINSAKYGTMIFKYTGLKPNQAAYIMVDGSFMTYTDALTAYHTPKNRVRPIQLFVNNKLINSQPKTYQPIGTRADANGNIIFKIIISPRYKHVLTFRTPKLVTINTANLDNIVNTAQTNKWNLRVFKDNYLAGYVNIKKGQNLVTTIPYSTGWSATVDGKKVPITKTLNLFIGIKMKPGQHNVVLKYHTPGFKLGLIISILGIILAIVYIAVRRKNNE